MDEDEARFITAIADASIADAWRNRGQHACGFLIRIRELEGRVEDVVLQRRLLECAGEVSKDNRTFKLIPYDLYRDLCNALAPKP